ncbi:MAG: PQQ-dependent sugar dehydrogenase, partial [Candidatus Nanohaloarchaea archaeon]
MQRRTLAVIILIAVAGAALVQTSPFAEKHAVVDCSNRLDGCQNRSITRTIESCESWWPDPDSAPECTYTREDVADVALVSDRANHVPGPVTNLSVTQRIWTPEFSRPHDMGFLPDGDMLVVDGPAIHTVRNGSIRDTVNLSATIPHPPGTIVMGSELLVDRAFETNRYVYLYYAVADRDADSFAATKNGSYFDIRLSRFRWEDGGLRNETGLLNITGGLYNSGADLIMDGQGRIYFSVGSGTDDTQAQNRSSYRGSVVRLSR